MTAIQTICQSGVLLNSGKLIAYGEICPIVKTYLSADTRSRTRVGWDAGSAPGNEVIRLYHAEVRSGINKTSFIYAGEPIEIEIEFAKLQTFDGDFDITFHLIDELGATVFVGSTAFEMENGILGDGRMKIKCVIPQNLMQEGNYTVSRLLFLKNRGTGLFSIRNLLNFEILPKRNGSLGWMARKEGIVRPKLDWQISHTMTEWTSRAQE